MPTLTDMFCGAGGSSTGAIQVPGVTVRLAMNHWALAIETHYTILGTKRQQVRQAGNAVTPPAARDLVTAQVKRSGIRRTNAYRGLPDGKVKYDPVLRDAIVERIVRRELTVSEGAAELGCALKHMDKRARMRRRELGLPDLRPRNSS